MNYGQWRRQSFLQHYHTNHIRPYIHNATVPGFRPPNISEDDSPPRDTRNKKGVHRGIFVMESSQKARRQRMSICNSPTNIPHKARRTFTAVRKKQRYSSAVSPVIESDCMASG